MNNIVLVIYIFISYVDQVRIHSFLEKTKKKKNVTDNKLEDISETATEELEKLRKEQEKLRKKVTNLIKKQKLQQVKGIVKGQDDSKPWGQEAHVKVCDVCSCKCRRLFCLLLLFC